MVKKASHSFSYDDGLAENGTVRRHYSYPLVFLLGALMYLVAVLPFLVYHQGLFFYYGDYNVQQVPFYILANRAVHQGNFFWNPHVDLGASMGGAFAFYLWGSPFFWLSTLFPEQVVPYLLPFLMALKYGTAMCASYAYARTLTRTERGALVSAMLFSFSGIFAVNIVFQHMHEAMALFPLYLIAFDRFVQTFPTEAVGARRSENEPSSLSAANHARLPFLKRNVSEWLPFVLMTTLSLIVNYYFFYGQVLFIVIYYFVRYVVGSHQAFRQTLRQIVSLLLYGVLGVALAAFFLIQVLDILQGNSRLDDTILGYDMIAYSEPTTPLAILKSMFYIPDIIGRGTLFTSEQIRNSSLSLYLPGFSMAGVIGYLLSHRDQKSWKKNLVIVFVVIAFIPVLNAAFSAFNNEYYARWFYMPLLFLAIMTARELEDCETAGLRKGLLVCWIAYAVIFLLSFLPSRSEDGTLQWLSIMKYPNLFYVEALATIVCLLLATILILAPAGWKKAPVVTYEDADDVLNKTETQNVDAAALTTRNAEHQKQKIHYLPLAAKKFHPDRNGLLTARAVCIIMVACLFSTMGVLFNGNSLIAHSGGVKWKQQMLDNKPVLPGADSDQWFRVEADGTSTNYEMVWGYPTIHCFESTVTPSIVDFYKGIGITRTVDSKMNFNHIGARYILSLRYYLDNNIISHDETYDDKGGLAGFEKVSESDGYNIYVNQHFIPMGFTFDAYMTEDDYAAIDGTRCKDRMLVRAIVLDEEDAAAYGDRLLTKISTDNAYTLSDDELFTEADARAKTACNAFAYSNSGFTATTSNLPAENLVFFSVPWDKGWTAYIDGEKTDIVKADFGLMAVDVPAGVHEITFTYLPYGFRAGCAVSAAALVVVIVLAAASSKRHRARL